MKHDSSFANSLSASSQVVPKRQTVAGPRDLDGYITFILDEVIFDNSPPPEARPWEGIFYHVQYARSFVGQIKRRRRIFFVLLKNAFRHFDDFRDRPIRAAGIRITFYVVKHKKFNIVSHREPQ